MTARQALPMLGLDGAGLDLLRLGENAIFRAVGTDLVLRVARPGISLEDVSRVVKAASALAAAGVPIAEPAVSVVPEPVALPTGTVSVWVYHEQLSRESFGYEDFGRLLAQFHQLSSAVRELLQPWDPLAMSVKRLGTLPGIGVPPEWISFLTEFVAQVETDLAEYEPQLAVDVIHGDAHSGNALNTVDGLLLGDLDNLAIGPREVDFVPTLVQDRRFARSSDRWTEVARGYGYDGPPPASADSPLIRARELHMVMWLLQQWGLNEESDRELAIRVKSLDDPADRLTVWNPH
jgi:Ser/Thr protein kinase RdoA (MazF antagonist)